MNPVMQKLLALLKRKGLSHVGCVLLGIWWVKIDPSIVAYFFPPGGNDLVGFAGIAATLYSLWLSSQEAGLKVPRIRIDNAPVILFALALPLLCGCGTFRMTPTQGVNGPDGAMLSCSWGHNPRQALCAADPDQIPAQTYEAAPERRTWVGRAMVKVGNGLSTGVKATADWTAEHPFLAGSIAAIGAGVAIGAKNDWWGMFGGDDDGDKKDAAPDVAPAGSDEKIAADVKGNNNTTHVSYTYVAGGGPMPNVGIRVTGDNNTTMVDAKPLED